eukprot:1105654-Rhodomonas_salina.1
MVLPLAYELWAFPFRLAFFFFSFRLAFRIPSVLISARDTSRRSLTVLPTKQGATLSVSFVISAPA